MYAHFQYISNMKYALQYTVGMLSTSTLLNVIH